ncbi:MAG: amidohydrolase [Desulfohalobiaceae bacterium]
MMQKADLILRNGSLVNPFVGFVGQRTVCVRDGRISAIQREIEDDRCVGNDTKVLELNGKPVLPGFHDAHGHLLKLGYSLQQIDLTGCSSYSQFLQRVEKEQLRYNPTEWIVGIGWQHEMWADPYPSFRSLPTNRDISSIVRESPMLLFHISGHLLLANDAAIAALHPNSYRTNPNVVRNDSGELTGIFLEDAKDLFDAFWQHPDTDKDAARRAIDECLKHGITCFHDAATTLATFDTFRQVYSSGSRRIRLNTMLHGRRETGIEKIIKKGRFRAFDDHLLMHSLKLFADGALGTHTALLHEPYADKAHEYGEEAMSYDRMESLATLAAEYGFQTCTHAIGDKAAARVLDMYHRILARHCTWRPRLEHAQLLMDESVQRMAHDQIIASIQAVQAQSDAQWLETVLGTRQLRLAYRWKDLWDAGVVLANGSDAPVDDVDPLHALRLLMSPHPIHGTRGFELGEAVAMLTYNSAYAGHMEEHGGVIEIGKWADITVLSGPPGLPIHAEEQSFAATIVNGIVQYKRDDLLHCE